MTSIVIVDCFRPRIPPTRPGGHQRFRITIFESGTVERGEIPVVEIPVRSRRGLAVSDPENDQVPPCWPGLASTEAKNHRAEAPSEVP